MILLEATLRHIVERDVTEDSQHGFTKNKSCLINLAAFYNGVTTLVDKFKGKDMIYLDVCKGFDTVPHNILLPKLKRYGFDGWTVRWIRNWLEGRSKTIVVNNSMYKWMPVKSGVPQWSILELVMFNISMT